MLLYISPSTTVTVQHLNSVLAAVIFCSDRLYIQPYSNQNQLLLKGRLVWFDVYTRLLLSAVAVQHSAAVRFCCSAAAAVLCCAALQCAVSVVAAVPRRSYSG